MLESVAFGQNASEVVGERELERATVLQVQHERRADETGRVGQGIDRDRAFDAMPARDRQARRQHRLEPVDMVGDAVERVIVDDDAANARAFFYEIHMCMLARFASRLNSPHGVRASFNVPMHCYKLTANDPRG